MKKLLLIFTLIFTSTIYSQVGVTKSNGIRYRGYTTAQIQSLPNPTNGYTVNNSETNSKWEYQNGIWVDTQNTDSQTAAEVPITDTGANFTATDVEGALAELAAGGGAAYAPKTIVALDGNGDITAGNANIHSGASKIINQLSAAEDIVVTLSNANAGEVDEYSFDLNNASGSLTFLSTNGFVADGFTGNSTVLNGIGEVDFRETGVNTGVFKVYPGSNVSYATYTPPSAFDGTFEFPFQGNTTETTGNHSPTVTGTLAYVTGPNATYSQAANFTGSQYLELAASADFSTTNMTIATWVRDPVVGTGYEAILEHDRLAANWYGMFKDGINDDELNFRYRANGVGVAAEIPSFYSSTWKHVILTVDGTTVRAYVNGVEVVELTGQALATATVLDSIRIGANQDGAEFLTMELAGLQFWNTGKTPAEVATIWTNAQ